MADKQKHMEDQLIRDMASSGEFSEAELQSMHGLLEGVKDWGNEEVLPSTKVKKALMDEMENNRQKKGTIWLNGMWAWLFPANKSFYKTPLFQLGMAAGCVILVVSVLNFNASEENKTNHVAEANELPKKDAELLPEDLKKDNEQERSKEVQELELDLQEGKGLADKRELANELETSYESTNSDNRSAEGSAKVADNLSFKQNSGNAQQRDVKKEIAQDPEPALHKRIPGKNASLQSTPAPPEGYYFEAEQKDALAEKAMAEDREVNFNDDYLKNEDKEEADQFEMGDFASDETVVNTTFSGNSQISDSMDGIESLSSSGNVTTSNSSSYQFDITKTTAYKDLRSTKVLSLKQSRDLDLIDVLYTAR